MSRKPSSHWCFLRDSTKLKAMVKYKLRESGLILAEVTKETGVPGYRISAWLNGKRPYPNQYQVIKLCLFLGVELDLNIGVTSSETTDA